MITQNGAFDFKNCVLDKMVVVDTDGSGKIRCADINYDTSVVDKEALPWIEPLSLGGNQCFTIIPKKQKVWVIKDTTNLNAMLYLPAPDMDADTQQFIDENQGQNPEVLSLRKGMAGDVTAITATDQDGYKIQTQNSAVNVNPEGKIISAANGTELTVDTMGATLKASGETQSVQAINSDSLYNFLKGFKSVIQELDGITSSGGDITKLNASFKQLNAQLNSITNSSNYYSEHFRYSC